MPKVCLLLLLLLLFNLEIKFFSRTLRDADPFLFPFLDDDERRKAILLLLPKKPAKEKKRGGEKKFSWEGEMGTHQDGKRKKKSNGQKAFRGGVSAIPRRMAVTFAS